MAYFHKKFEETLLISYQGINEKVYFPTMKNGISKFMSRKMSPQHLSQWSHPKLEHQLQSMKITSLSNGLQTVFSIPLLPLQNDQSEKILSFYTSGTKLTSCEYNRGQWGCSTSWFLFLCSSKLITFNITCK